MPKVIIKDMGAGLDGTYELDLEFTHRDFRTIKQLAGVRANEVTDALNAGDLDIVVALAEIALRRAGAVHSVEHLWDAKAGAITLEFDEQEVTGSPPLPGSERSSDAGSEPSGAATNDATESSPETSTPDASGIRQPVGS